MNNNVYVLNANPIAESSTKEDTMARVFDFTSYRLKVTEDNLNSKQSPHKISTLKELTEEDLKNLENEWI